MELLLEWDNALFQLINQQWASEKLDAFMRILSSKYTFIPFYIWFIVKVIKDYGRKFYLPLLMAVLAFALADSISAKVFKPGFKRLRPAFEETLNPRLPDGMPGGKYGFVSSHAANAFAIYPLLILIGLSKKKVTFKTNKTMKIGFWISIVVAVAISYSRVYLGRHYVGDVFFGGMLGVIIGHSLWLVFNRYLRPKLDS